MKKKIIQYAFQILNGMATVLIFLFFSIPIIILYFITLALIKIKFLFNFRYKIFNFAVSKVPFLLGVIIRRHGRINKNLSIVVANHTSCLDYILIAQAMGINPWNAVAGINLAENKSSFANKIISWTIGYWVKNFSISADRNDEASRINASRRIIKELLIEKRNVAIFPEGGRTEKKIIKKEKILLETFDDGVFKISWRYKIPIQPIVFSWPVIWRGKNDDRWGIRPCIVDIYYLDVLHPEKKYKTIDDFINDCRLRMQGQLERSKKIKRFLKS